MSEPVMVAVCPEHAEPAEAGAKVASYCRRCDALCEEVPMVPVAERDAAIAERDALADALREIERDLESTARVRWLADGALAALGLADS